MFQLAKLQFSALSLNFLTGSFVLINTMTPTFGTGPAYLNQDLDHAKVWLKRCILCSVVCLVLLFLFRVFITMTLTLPFRFMSFNVSLVSLSSFWLLFKKILKSTINHRTAFGCLHIPINVTAYFFYIWRQLKGFKYTFGRN